MKLFNEAKNHHILTTVQALGVMSIREASSSRISQSNFLSGQSIRLAVEMGLSREDALDDGDATKAAVREATFWAHSH